MAVFRCEVKTINRASGRSAVAAAAYRAAERLRDERANDGAGKEHDYRRRAPGVLYREVMAPKDAPEWATKRGRLWNEAERAEKRKNSVTAREIIISLPHELDDVRRIEMTRGFASRLMERYGVAVDVAIHKPDRKGDQRNHHAHLLMTTRRMGREGLGEKTRELDDMKKRGPEEIEAIREMWEREQNLALERAGLAERVSRLSNKAQGIEREPQPKLGEAATALMRRGEPSRLADRWKQVAARNTEREKKHSAMRENMAKKAAAQAEQRRREREERIAREKLPGGLIHGGLQAAAQQRAREQGPAHIADALMRDTTEAQRGKQEAERRARIGQDTATPKTFNAQARREKLAQQAEQVRHLQNTRRRTRPR